MAETESSIDVQRTTLGGALRNGPLTIPPYQREYSWKRERVRKLFDDFQSAMIKRQAAYFLGTVMTTPGRPPSVIDGQQRLATTMIFLSAARDAFLDMGKVREAESVEQAFLLMYDRHRKEDVPRLTLNTDDRAYMKARVLDRPTDRDPNLEPRFHSHRLIDHAAGIARERVQQVLAGADKKSGKVDLLNAWIDFIDNNAIIVVLTPPNAARAYQMFKTLNDRAQRTTQADMIKNHLFEQADDQVNEAQSKWTAMRCTIEGSDQAKTDDPLLAYLHHVSIVFYGQIVADDIFEVMEERVSGRANALKFLEGLASYASDYSAILTPTHGKWGLYDQQVRALVQHISVDVRMSFIRPLMLSVAARFSKTETVRTFRMMTSWVVRFLIAGGSRSGVVEKAFSEAAHDIREKKITTAKELLEAVRETVPSDTKFRQAFKTKAISNSRQARFILLELEAEARKDSSDPHLTPVANTKQLTLEHILPKNPEVKAGWDHFTHEERKAFHARLGNLALIGTKDNGAINDKPFAEKRPVIEKSKYIRLTADIIDRTTTNPSKWEVKHIRERQEMMADLAVDHWPLTGS